MPKILYLVTEDWFFVSHFLPMAQAARDCGLQVAIATRVREDGERLKAEGFSVIAIESRRGSFSLLRSLRDFFQALKIVREQRADIVHCIALRPVVIGGLAAKLAGNGALVVAPTGLGHLWIEAAWPYGSPASSCAPSSAHGCAVRGRGICSRIAMTRKNLASIRTAPMLPLLADRASIPRNFPAQ